MAESSNWYELNHPEKTDTPALLIYKERVLQNIGHFVGMVTDTAQLRPHVKTNKSSEATKLMMDAGIHKFKCATIAEADMLGTCGASDVLLAYQPVGPKQDRFLRLMKLYPKTRFSCLIDDVEVAKQLASKAAKEGLQVEVFLDINSGMNRTGILPAPQGIALLHDITPLQHLTTRGIHAYDGHINHPDLKERTAGCDKAFDQLGTLISAFEGHDIKPELVIGGSPTFPIHAKREGVQCSPGTFVYWDKGYSQICAEQPFVSAALVISRIISMPGENRLCLDLGHKSIAPENPLDRRVYFLNAPNLKFVGQSEEHLVVEAEEGHNWKIGDLLYGMPIHICPTVALYEKASVVESGVVTGQWKTDARARSLKV